MDALTSPSALTTTGPATAAANSGADTSVTGDFETFLTLLTAQLRNQDPSEPVDSTQFVAQLASFSAVEQQVETNTQLAQLVAIMGDGDMNGLAAWIGTEIRVTAPAAFTGDPVEVALKPVADADRAIVEIRNDFDQVIATRTLAPDATDVVWDGLTSSGEIAPLGQYRFEASYFAGDTLLGTAKGETYSRVSEVLIEEGKPVLVTEAGKKVGIEDVQALRNARPVT